MVVGSRRAAGAASLRRRIVLLLALLWLPLSACESKTLRIQLPGFADGAIEGIFLWRQSSGNSWQRVCRIDFTDLRITSGGETLSYVQNCIGGVEQPGVVLPAKVSRPPSAPSTITVELVYLRYEPPGNYRASAFNAAGESPMSSSSTPL